MTLKLRKFEEGRKYCGLGHLENTSWKQECKHGT